MPTTSFKVKYFNPRLREGGDGCNSWRFIVFGISIHASAKEATSADTVAITLGTDFNPRLREGGDLYPFSIPPIIKIFQSTPPRRRRHTYTYDWKYRWGFQSTPPRRRRLIKI